jgi:hypothetical protein
VSAPRQLTAFAPEGVLIDDEAPHDDTPGRVELRAMRDRGWGVTAPGFAERFMVRYRADHAFMCLAGRWPRLRPAALMACPSCMTMGCERTDPTRRCATCAGVGFVAPAVLPCVLPGCGVPQADADDHEGLCRAHGAAYARACSHLRSCACRDCDVHDAVCAARALPHGDA